METQGWEKTISPIWGKLFIRRKHQLKNASLTYLGTVISSNGKFEANIQQLWKIASIAMYTLLSHTNKYSGGTIKLPMDLFDKIIVPICTYNSEVWGSALFTKQFLAIVFYLKINRKTQYRKFKYRFWNIFLVLIHAVLIGQYLVKPAVSLSFVKGS